MKKEKIEEILEDVNAPNSVFNVVTSDIWLSEMGYLTENYLKGSLKLIRLIDRGVKRCELDYDKGKNLIKCTLKLSWFSYWFRRSKLYNKILIFCENNFVEQDVDLKFMRYKKESYERTQRKKRKEKEAEGTPQGESGSSVE